jgi:hypothetical protein
MMIVLIALWCYIAIEQKKAEVLQRNQGALVTIITLATQ